MQTLCRIRLILLASTLVMALTPAASVADGAASTAPNETAPEGDDVVRTVPEVLVTAERPPVEQGERSNLAALPPRDLRQRPLTESPGLETATSVVGENQIEWQESYSVVDALQYVPGAWTEARGRTVKQFISVRGQTYPYPEYLVDGAYFREFHEMDYFLEAAALERVEVLRSSAVLLHGPGGMNGMINLVPKRYTGPETTLTQIYGSENLTRTQLTYGTGNERTSLGLGVGFRHTDGNKEMNAEENIANVHATLAHDVSDVLTLSVTHLAFFGNRELEKAEGTNVDPRFLTREDQFDPMRAYAFVGKAHYHPSDTAWTEVTGNYGLRRFFGHQTNQTGWLEEDVEYGARVVQGVRPCDANTLRVGTTFHRWRTPTGKRFYVGNPGDIRTWTAFVVDEHDFGRLLVNTGYRMTWEYIKQFGGFSVEGSAAGGLRNVMIEDEHAEPLGTYTLGGVYDLGQGWSLHGNVAWGQIASRPGMFTLAGDRPDAETRFKYDVGVRRAWDAFGEVAATVFYVDQQNAPLGQNATVRVNGERVQVFAAGDRRTVGAELEARSKRFACGTQFFVNTTLMTARREQGGRWRNDQEVPNLVVGAGVSQLVGRDWEISIFTKRVGDYENERFTANNVPEPLGDFTEVNAKVTRLFGDDRQHRAFLLVENLGGQHYRTVHGWPDPGVEFFGGVSLTW